MAVYSAYVCLSNAELLPHVLELYAPAGNGLRVADVTYGKGTFWKLVDLEQYDFHPSDMVTCPEHPYDFRALPYADNEFDAVVFDPPYMHSAGSALESITKLYQNNETTKGLSHEGIISLYTAGMAEAYRVLKAGGYLMVKCQDEVGSGHQQWSHIEIMQGGESLGFEAVDLFVYVQSGCPAIREPMQIHARKRHSYFWVMGKLPLNKCRPAPRRPAKPKSMTLEESGFFGDEP
jgi:hypothetical protein